jgi:formylglycine-generating enzyme required for sulfatase activity
MSVSKLWIAGIVSVGCVAALVAVKMAGIGAPASSAVAATQSCPKHNTSEQVLIPGGTFMMGSDSAYPDEAPRRETKVGSIEIDRYEVTNGEFAAFVSATGYVTVAERKPDAALHPDIDPAQLVPGSAVFQAPKEATQDLTEWWHFTPGADWRHPMGPGSSIKGRDDYPVVHIAYADAVAYAKWRGRRLPTEAEWEHAAQPSNADEAGKPVSPDGRWRANVWQGEFPITDTGKDGFIGLAPVGCFQPNVYGLYDMIGNVWEWTSDDYSSDPNLGVTKGGSYLCAENYCARYRSTARQPMERDFSASHIGFRTVADVAPAQSSAPKTR